MAGILKSCTDNNIIFLTVHDSVLMYLHTPVLGVKAYKDKVKILPVSSTKKSNAPNALQPSYFNDLLQPLCRKQIIRIFCQMCTICPN